MGGLQAETIRVQQKKARLSSIEKWAITFDEYKCQSGMPAKDTTKYCWQRNQSEKRPSSLNALILKYPDEKDCGRTASGDYLVECNKRKAH